MPVSFMPVRLSVWALLGLYVVTCGMMGPAWVIWRKSFFDRLDSPVRLGALAWLPLPLMLGGLGLVVAQATTKGDPSGVRMMSNIGGIVLLFAFFRVRRILEYHFARNHMGVGALSGVATFFLGALYLQYKINEAADRHG